MNAANFPTKGNLILARRSLTLAKLGYELLDRKRNVMVMEMMRLIDDAKSIQGEIDSTFSQAYSALQIANITLGICQDIALSVPVDDSVHVRFRSVMGVEIPIVSAEPEPPRLYYGFGDTNSKLDESFISFLRVKRLSTRLAMIENSIYRLADAIKRTQKRANALKNIIIPRYNNLVKTITDSLEEKEREEFTRLKVIKNKKLRAK